MANEMSLAQDYDYDYDEYAAVTEAQQMAEEERRFYQEVEKVEKQEKAMATGRIEKVEQSRTGKSVTVTVDGNRYTCRDKSIQNLQTGTLIEFEEGSFEWNGKHVTTIESYSVKGPAPKSGGGSSDEPALRFVSNVVAHAIQSGRIEEPSQIAMWAKTAYNVAISLGQEDEGEVDPSDDIPF